MPIGPGSLAAAPPITGPPDTRPFGLDWLVSPVTAAEFLRTHWEAAPLLVTRDAPDYYAGLPGLDAVDELITTTASGPVNAIENGRLVKTDPSGLVSERAFRLTVNRLPDIQDVYRAYHDGYSVIVNRVHQRSAAIARLCAALEADLHHPVGANMYLTPRVGQGFRPHVDTHDVFIVQLHGVKEWHVSDATSELPLLDDKIAVESLPDARTYTLRPGDAFYLPRGFPHEAVTTSSSSLHITVGVHAYTWLDLAGETLALLARDRVALRRGLPPAFLDGRLDPATLSEIATDIALALTDDELVERVKARLGSRLLASAKAAGTGQFHALDALASLDAESVVSRSPGLLCRVRCDAREAVIEFASNYVSGPAFLEPALTFIAERDEFTVGALPGELSDEDKVDLVSRLVSEGLLNCTDGPKGGSRDGR